VSTVVSGLTIPWDVAFAPDGTMVYDQRGGGLSARLADGRTVEISTDLSDLWASGETGLMGLAIDPSFAQNRKLYACFGHQGADGGTDVRIAAFTVAADWASAQRQDQPLLTGIGTSSGRHGGCRIRFDATGLLYVGTGDAAIGTNPQDRGSLNGKVLRLTTAGQPASGNPFLTASDPKTRYLYSYGHRNVQGLALRPGTDQMWTIEQGTDKDDEVNRPVAGGNFGYDPVPKAGATASYNEAVPMTDPQLGDVVAAVVSSGDPTEAWSGGTWISGAQWGKWDGVLAVAALKATRLDLFTIDAADKLVTRTTLPQLDGTHGRLRGAVLGPDGALYVTTSNGGGKDEILRVAAS
jgi:aldose sugar dehydrogenase